MMEVVWLVDAASDLKEIAQYIAQDDPGAAYHVALKIKASADSLAHNPELGRPGRVANTRELIIAGLPYILPYTIKKKQVCILAVMHNSRKWPDGFSSTK